MAKALCSTSARGAAIVGALMFAPLASVAASADPITIDMHDGIVTPAEITVPAGETITLIVRNTGKAPVEFESLKLRQEKVLVSGQKFTVKLKGLLPGAYPFVDDFHSGTGRGVLLVK